jgi:CBS domain-containing protein
MLDAARTMREHRVEELVIVEQSSSERVPLGVVAGGDLVRAIAEDLDLHSTKVADLVARDPLMAESDQDVEKVAHEMLARGVRRLPVVNSLGALVGLVTYDDLVAWMAGELATLARLFSR